MKLKVFLNMYGFRQEVGLLYQDKQRIFFKRMSHHRCRSDKNSRHG